MARSSRLAVGMLVAYAASITLYASYRSAEVFLFRRIITDPGQKARFSANDYLMRLAKDYGTDLTPREQWALRIADVEGSLLVPLIVLFFLVGIGASFFYLPSRSNIDKE